MDEEIAQITLQYSKYELMSVKKVSQQCNRYFIFNTSENTNIFTDFIAQKRNMVIPGQLFVSITPKNLVC